MEAETFAYVANNSSGDVSVIRISDNAVVATPPAVSAFEVAISADGGFVCVAGSSSNSVTVIPTSDNRVAARVLLDGPVADCSFTPDGAFIYATHQLLNGVVSVIRSSDWTVVATVPLGSARNPWGVAVTPDGTFAYVTNFSSTTVSVIRTADFTVVETVAVGSGPWGIAIGAPAVAPAATLSLNAACFRVDDPLQLDLRLLTASASPAGGAYCFELKWWLETPLVFPADRISLANLAGPGNALCLPPAFDQTVRLVDIPVPAALSAGKYRFGARLSDPIGGRSLSFSSAPFEVGECLGPEEGS